MIRIPLLKNTESNNFFLIAGPCAIESEEMAMEIAEELIKITDKLSIPFIFKGSYRKANRSSIHSFTGIGDQKALNILAKVRKEFNVPVTTDIHADIEAAIAAEYVDILQNSGISVSSGHH
jgi:2-dehydro-3-deoxyphosphooctonate aldolase (KDO 8-P synthase)